MARMARKPARGHMSEERRFRLASDLKQFTSAPTPSYRRGEQRGGGLKATKLYKPIPDMPTGATEFFLSQVADKVAFRALRGRVNYAFKFRHGTKIHFALAGEKAYVVIPAVGPMRKLWLEVRDKEFSAEIRHFCKTKANFD